MQNQQRYAANFAVFNTFILVQGHSNTHVAYWLVEWHAHAWVCFGPLHVSQTQYEHFWLAWKRLNQLNSKEASKKTVNEFWIRNQIKIRLIWLYQAVIEALQIHSQSLHQIFVSQSLGTPITSSKAQKDK